MTDSFIRRGGDTRGTEGQQCEGKAGRRWLSTSQGARLGTDPSGWPSDETRPAGISVLDFKPPELGEDLFLLFESSILLSQP